MATEPDQRPNGPPAALHRTAGTSEGSLGIAIGLLASCAFFLFAWAVPMAWVQRYFLGHPVAIATTIMFAFGVGILLIKSLRISAAARMTAELRDADLAPAVPAEASSADQWLAQHDAGRVAKQWLDSLGQLPQTAQQCPLVVRLGEILWRQSGRVTTTQLSDDLREVSAREGDSAHDSLQLVRIIIWAIPMLGFLGTVIGITQTLGGLDFTDGTAAVDRLKSGLYVAFDTTALGLVLSVVAIFLQFPVERSEQQLLAEIDRRVATLLAAHLPADETADNPTAHISLLCDGIRVAVAESLASQTELWRTTIDAAHAHWERVADENGQRIGEALVKGLAPVLQRHADSLAEHSQSLGEHVNSLGEVRQAWNTDLEQRWQKWTDAFSRGSDLLRDHQQTLVQQSTALTLQSENLAQHSGRLADQTGELAETSRRAEHLSQLQRSLDGSLLRLAEVNAAVQHSLQIRDEAKLAGTVADQLSDAMLVLARAVDVLNKRLPAAALQNHAVPQNSTAAHTVRGSMDPAADSFPAARRAA